MINLVSDTITRPTPAMLEAMMAAQVGDDVFGEDPTVNALEAKAAAMFGKESALFCPSGTMTNQIALKAHTQPLDEVICDRHSHIYHYEVGGYAFHSGIAIQLLDGEQGRISATQVEAGIKPLQDWLPKSTLVVLENTCNRAGGSYYRIEDMRAIREVCRRRGLKLHLDGARLFNALIESGGTTLEIGAIFDSISICLSKGLGAPVGSLLIGDTGFIKASRRIRKVMGGGMRQAGYLAAAGIYALDNHLERLVDDHARARQIAELLSRLSYVENLRPVSTNIVIFDLVSTLPAAGFLEALAAKGVKASSFGPHTVRMVTHLDFTDEMLGQTLKALPGLF